MVDAHVSGACGAIREGSSPSFDRFIIAFQPNTSGLEQNWQVCLLQASSQVPPSTFCL